MQLAPAASVGGQLDEAMLKSEALAPVVVTDRPVVVPAVAFPAFETVKVNGALLPLTVVL